MPLYEYECTACNRRTEKIQKFSDPELTDCPHCGGRLERTLTAPAVQFKGSGWYKDLYSSAKPAAASSSEGSAASGDGSTSTGPAKSESTGSSAPASTSAPAPAATERCSMAEARALGLKQPMQEKAQWRRCVPRRKHIA